MLKPNRLSVACFVLLVPTIAVAQKTDTGIYTVYLNASNVSAPPTDPPKVVPSQVKFLSQWACSVDISDTVVMQVRGVAARDVDLSDDLTAQQLLLMGFAFGQERCPLGSPGNERDYFQGRPRGRSVSVQIKPGDPATVSAADLSALFKVRGFGTTFDTPPDLVSGYWTDSKPGMILSYQNAPRALKLSQAADAEEARHRNAALEQQRQAELKKQSEISVRSAAFVKANRVARFVTAEQLAANPFVYQGQIVATTGEFQQMNSATQALFSSRDKLFVVSGIPTARFTRQKSMALVAGRVQGNIEVKLLVLGPTLVAHLSFVGSAFCQQYDCSDFNLAMPGPSAARLPAPAGVSSTKRYAEQKRAMADIRTIANVARSLLDPTRGFPEFRSVSDLARAALTSLPLSDPWGSRYLFLSSAAAFTITSFGADGARDPVPPRGPTSTFNADIIYSERSQPNAPSGFDSWPEGPQH